MKKPVRSDTAVCVLIDENNLWPKQFQSSVIYGNLFKQKNELIIQISIIATESWQNLQGSSSENQCFAIAQIVLNASEDT